jgi:hypothetical protein
VALTNIGYVLLTHHGINGIEARRGRRAKSRPARLWRGERADGTTEGGLSQDLRPKGMERVPRVAKSERTAQIEGSEEEHAVRLAHDQGEVLMVGLG